MTVLRLSPASSGLFSRRMLNTLPRSCSRCTRENIITLQENMSQAEYQSKQFFNIGTNQLNTRKKKR